LSYKIVKRNNKRGKIMFKTFWFICFSILIFSNILFAQEVKQCSNLNYQDKNQVTPDPLVVKKIIGQVVIKDDESAPLVDVCVALFDEENKKLIFVTTPDEKGEFNIKKVPDGKYRLIVKHLYDFYCVANVPITVEKKSFEKRELPINMIPSAIDEWSYGCFKTLKSSQKE